MAWLWIAYCSFVLFICTWQCYCQDTVSNLNVDDVLKMKDEAAQKTLLLFVPPDCKEQCKSHNLAIDELSSFLSPSIYFARVVSDKIPWCETCKTPAFVILYYTRRVLLQDSPVNTDTVQNSLNLVESCHLFKLSDATFEHDTQATTGGTTGDWLVIFESNPSPASLMQYEGLALRLRPLGVNVALVSPDNSHLTYKRFNVATSGRSDTPHFIALFRRGTMYEFDTQFDPHSTEQLFQFATKYYKDLRKTPIPREIQWFDDFMDNLVEKLKATEKLLPPGVLRAILLAFFIALVFFGVLIIVCWPSQTQQVAKKKKE